MPPSITSAVTCTHNPAYGRLEDRYLSTPPSHSIPTQARRQLFNKNDNFRVLIIRVFNDNFQESRNLNRHICENNIRHVVPDQRTPYSWSNLPLYRHMYIISTPRCSSSAIRYDGCNHTYLQQSDYQTGQSWYKSNIWFVFTAQTSNQQSFTIYRPTCYVVE